MMSPEQQQALQQKKEQLRLRIAFEAFIDTYILPFTALLDEFQNLKIGHRVVALRCIPGEFKDMLSERFNTEDYKKYNLTHIEISTDDTWLGKLLQSYPNTHPLRYVPDLPVIGSIGDGPSVVLAGILNDYLPTKQDVVYLCYLKYAFLMEVDLQGLAQNADWQIFNIWEGDAVIFPKELDWLIAYSLEEEWRFGVNLKIG